MNVICLISLKPNKIWCDFLNTFSKYKIYNIIDDNNFNLEEFKNNYNNINFIQIEDEKCKMNGYIELNYICKKIVSGWDKALYYFGIENNKYDYIWFMEDDVFFNSEDTLINIDSQYNNDDLLSSIYHENTNGNNFPWLWPSNIKHKYTPKYLPPYYYGMMSVVRFSNKMLKYINVYARQHNTLCFLESLFPTLAIKNELKYNNPSQLINIFYRHDFKEENIDNNNLYHPVKNLNDHINFRQLKSQYFKKENI
jgi:hypothetical protein